MLEKITRSYQKYLAIERAAVWYGQYIQRKIWDEQHPNLFRIELDAFREGDLLNVYSTYVEQAKNFGMQSSELEQILFNRIGIDPEKNPEINMARLKEFFHESPLVGMAFVFSNTIRDVLTQK